jgi:hypothetical protein
MNGQHRPAGFVSRLRAWIRDERDLRALRRVWPDWSIVRRGPHEGFAAARVHPVDERTDPWGRSNYVSARTVREFHHALCLQVFAIERRRSRT